MRIQFQSLGEGRDEIPQLSPSNSPAHRVYPWHLAPGGLMWWLTNMPAPSPAPIIKASGPAGDLSPRPEPMSVALMWPELPRCYRSHNHPPYCRHLPGVSAGPVSTNQRPEMGHDGPIRGWHHRLHTWHLTGPASGHHVTSWKVEMWKVMQMSWSSVPWMSIEKQERNFF